MLQKISNKCLYCELWTFYSLKIDTAIEKFGIGYIFNMYIYIYIYIYDSNVIVKT